MQQHRLYTAKKKESLTRQQRKTYATLRELAIVELDAYVEYGEFDDVVNMIESLMGDGRIDTSRLDVNDLLVDRKFQRALKRYVNGLIGVLQQQEDINDVDVKEKKG